MTVFGATYPQAALPAALIAGATLAAGLAAPAFAALAAAGAFAFALARGCVRLDRATLASWAGPALAMAIAGAAWGGDAAAGVFLIWRIHADARWSAREGRRLAQLSGRVERGLMRAHYYATPALGLAVAAYTAPHLLLGAPLDLPHAPLIVPLATGAIAAAALFDWGMRRLTDWRLGANDGAATRHALTHHALFLAAYVISPDLSAGLMAMIVWRMTRFPLVREFPAQRHANSCTVDELAVVINGRDHSEPTRSAQRGFTKTPALRRL